MNREVEIKEMLAVARELMREWRRMQIYAHVITMQFGDDAAKDTLALFDAQFPKEAP